MSSPNRGEVWIVDLGLAGKVRPALVFSVAPAVGDRALVTLVTHTTCPRNSQFEVAVTARFLKPGVFDTQNIVTVPLAKLVRKIGQLSADQLVSVEQAVRRWLSL